MNMNKFIDELQAMIEEQSAKCGGNGVFLCMHPNTAEHLFRLCELVGTKIITTEWIDPDVIFIIPWKGIEGIKVKFVIDEVEN